MKRSLYIGLLLAVGTQLLPAFAQSARLSSVNQSLLFTDPASTCPVTLRPEKAFVPPFPYSHRPDDPVSFWYGTSELWTQVWAPPPWTPWKAQQSAKMFWASADKAKDEQPALVVSIKLLGEDKPSVTFLATRAASDAPKQLGMTAEVTFPSAGCWEVTGQYHRNSLSYVVQVETAASTSSAQLDQLSGTQAKSDRRREPGVERAPQSNVGMPVVAWRMVPNASCHTLIGGSASFNNERGCAVVCGGTKGPPCTEKQQKILDQLDRDREGRFAFERKLLLKAGVPFDPDILMEPLGQYKLKPVLEQMPEMKRSIRTDFLSGVIMADTLYVSGAVALGPEPTVVLVNHVVSDECIHLTTTQFGTDEFYSWSLESGRVLGMSLKQALEKNGLTMDLFPGSDHLPSFSVIRALNLPKVTCSNPTFDSRNRDTRLWESAIQH